MNIIFAVSNDLSRYSADIVYLMEMCNAFSKAGYDTTLCAPKTHTSTQTLFRYYGVEYPFKISEIQVPEIFLNGKIAGRGAVFSLLAAPKLNQADDTVILLRDPWLFFLIAVIFKRKCFLDTHKYRCEMVFQTSIFQMLVKRAVSSGYGSLICISNCLKTQWESHGIESSRMVVAHDAVNVSKFDASITKAEARKILGLAPDLPIVAYTGSLIPGKGVEVLVKCANRLPDVSFVIVGGEEIDIVPLKERVQNENVHFIGHVEPDKVPIYHAAADILALPNTRGSVIDDVTSPMKLFEYIASERPIVATDMPSLLEILTNDYSALISPAGDDLKLSENIALLFENPFMCCQLASNAKNRLAEFTWDARVRYLHQVFNG